MNTTVQLERLFGSEFGELHNVAIDGISSYRRGALIIEVWSECNHTFEIELQQHKGETFITSRIMEDANG